MNRYKKEMAKNEMLLKLRIWDRKNENGKRTLRVTHSQDVMKASETEKEAESKLLNKFE